jgi:serine/threonine protein kinase
MSVYPESGSDKIDKLLESCLELPRSAWEERLRQICREHPEHAGEMRRRYEELVHLGIVEASAPNGPEPNAMVGKYKLLERLGGGGMAVVYLARDCQSGRLVALKLIRQELLSLPSIRERFRRELEAAARVQHPNLCSVYEVGEQSGTPFLAMHYLGKTTLAKRLGSSESFSQEQVCRWFVELAEALHVVHLEGFVHRDVKPSNVMFKDEDHPILVDFGLSHVIDERASHALTMSGALIGTPAYMAPEQVLGDTRQIQPTTDVYGLGVTLYECLTRKRAFRAETLVAIYHKVLESDAPGVRSLDPEIPTDLALIVSTAMAKEPPERYSSTRALAEDLLRFLNGKNVRVRAPSLWLRTKRYCRRHPVASAFLAALLLLVLIGGLGFLHVRESLAREKVHSQSITTALNDTKSRYEERLDNVEALSLVRASQLAEEEDPPLARKLAEQALELDNNLHTRSQSMRVWAQDWHGTEFRGHRGDVYAFDISANDRLLVSGGSDNTVRLWDMSGQQLWKRESDSVETEAKGQLTPGYGNLLGAHFVGSRIVSCSAAGELRLWDHDGKLLAHHSLLEDGRGPGKIGTLRHSVVSAEHELLLVGCWRFARLFDLSHGGFDPIGGKLEHDGYVGGLAIHPEGRRIVTADAPLGMATPRHDRSRVMLWDRTDRGIELVRSLHEGSRSYGHVRFSPDGRYVATGGLGRTLIFDLVEESAVPSRLLRGLAQPEFLAERARSGSTPGWFIAAGSWSGQVAVHDVTGADWHAVQSLGTNLLDLSASPDGRFLAAACADGSLRLLSWDNEPLAKLVGHGERALRVRFLHSGQALLSSSDDDTLRLWRLEDPPNRYWPLEIPCWLVRTVPGTDELLCAPSLGHATCMSPTGATRLSVPVFNNPRFGFAPVLPSPDGKSIYSSLWERDTGTFRVTRSDRASGKELAQIRFPGAEVLRLSIAPLRSNDGCFIAYDWNVYLWQGEGVEADKIDSRVYPYIVAGPEHSALVFKDGSSGILEEKTPGEWSFRPLGVPMYRGAWSESGRLLGIVDQHSRVYLFHPDGSPHGPPFQSGKQDPYGIALSPDDAWVAIVSRDGATRVHSTKGDSWLELSIPGSEIRDACFSPDSRYLFSAHQDGRVMRWPLDPAGRR